MSDTTTNFCVWEDCDQEASYCEGHAHELVNPLGREFAPPAIEVNEDGVVTDKSQDADWLRARFFERSAEVEKLEERIELATAEGEAKDQRIAELEAKIDSLQTDIVDAYDLLDKAWGPLNAGQMQCNSCSTAYAYLDEEMTNLKASSEDTRKEAPE